MNDIYMHNNTSQNFYRYAITCKKAEKTSHAVKTHIHFIHCTCTCTLSTKLPLLRLFVTHKRVINTVGIRCTITPSYWLTSCLNQLPEFMHLVRHPVDEHDHNNELSNEILSTCTVYNMYMYVCTSFQCVMWKSIQTCILQHFKV